MYPWLSGKTINGVKMFELYKTGKAKNFKRPNLAISIKKVDKLNVSFITASRLRSEIMDKIRRVHGDFRQKSVLKGWSNFFKTHRRLQFQIFSFRVVVSSGTYVRCFCEYFAKKLKIPCFLLRLKRTKIIIKKCGLVTRKES
jgi:tRNA U55 pseudouridine synthase TruB